jgi:hypothetical protein
MEINFFVHLPNFYRSNTDLTFHIRKDEVHNQLDVHHMHTLYSRLRG